MPWFEQKLDQAILLIIEDEHLARQAKRTFSKQSWGQATILKAIGLPPAPLTQINTGSFATIYQYPGDRTKVIKVTRDTTDAKNLLKAQTLNSPNIVKIHQSAKIGDGAVLVADYVTGRPIPYTSSVLAALIDGKNGLDEPERAARKIMNHGLSPFRDRILAKFGKDTPQERRKLAELLVAIGKLRRRGVDLADFTDNIIDDGQHYVIIDMGL